MEIQNKINHINYNFMYKMIVYSKLIKLLEKYAEKIYNVWAVAKGGI